MIIDFGSSCYVKETVYTYIQSRFYRAPEVIMGLEYGNKTPLRHFQCVVDQHITYFVTGTEIDLWSFACILPELYTAYPLFPGENEGDQMACISELVGQPPLGIVNQSTRRRQLFNDNGELKITPSPRGKIRTPNARAIDDIRGNRPPDPLFSSFISNCLKWDPEERLTPSAAMGHPWIDSSDG